MLAVLVRGGVRDLLRMLARRLLMVPGVDGDRGAELELDSRTSAGVESEVREPRENVPDIGDINLESLFFFLWGRVEVDAGESMVDATTF